MSELRTRLEAAAGLISVPGVKYPRVTLACQSPELTAALLAEGARHKVTVYGPHHHEASPHVIESASLQIGVVEFTAQFSREATAHEAEALVERGYDHGFSRSASLL